MIRNYILGRTETLLKQAVEQADGSNQYLSIDGVYKNGFNTLLLYTDAAGAFPLPGAAYSETTVDADWTSDEAGTGGTGETVYSQYIVSDPTYQGIDLYADIKNFGTYTDNDAPFNQVGGEITVTATGTITPPDGFLRYLVISDTSGGANILTIAVPKFVGQDVFILCDGAGLTDVDFPGKKATGNVVISDGLMLRLTAISVTEYVAVNEVTADYVSGSENIFQKPCGDYETRVTDSYTTSASGLIAQFLAVVPISITDKVFASGSNSGADRYICNSNESSAGSLTFAECFVYKNGAIAPSITTRQITIIVKGKY